MHISQASQLNVLRSFLIIFYWFLLMYEGWTEFQQNTVGVFHQLDSAKQHQPPDHCSLRIHRSIYTLAQPGITKTSHEWINLFLLKVKTP